MSKLNKTCPLCGATDYSIKHGKDTKIDKGFYVNHVINLISKIQVGYVDY